MKPEEEIIIKYNGKGSPLTVQGPTTGFKKSQPSIKIASSRGDFDNPKLIQNGDQIGVLKFTAYTGATGESFVNSAFVSAIVTDNDLYQGKPSVDATLMLGCIKSIYNGNYVTINPDGVLSAPKIVLNFDKYAVEERDKTKDWWLSDGCKYDKYEVPFTINTKSTGIKINQSGNFKQPSLAFNSYDNNQFKAGWTAFSRFRGTEENPEPCKNGDFIYAFDWLGKSCNDQPWEWGMAQTAIVDGIPSQGFLPTSMNWVTRDTPYAKPEVRVKISNNGTLNAFYGSMISKQLELNLEEVAPEKINLSSIKFIKVLINGEYRAIPSYSILG